MKPEDLIGRLVYITDRQSIWHKHWGYIRYWDGDVFHVSGGSISDSQNRTMPIFDRDQFTTPRKLKAFIGAGAKVDSRGYELKEN